MKTLATAAKLRITLIIKNLAFLNAIMQMMHYANIAEK